MPVRDELLGDVVGEIDGRREAESFGADFADGDGSRDADDRTVAVEQRAARTALGDRRVGLDHVEQRRTTRAVDFTAQCTDDTNGHRRTALKAERRADGDRLLTDLQLGGRPEWCDNEIGDVVDLDDGDVGFGVAAEHSSRLLASISHLDCHLGRALDDVIVGDDHSVAAEDDARSAGFAVGRLHEHLDDRRPDPLGDANDVGAADWSARRTGDSRRDDLAFDCVDGHRAVAGAGERRQSRGQKGTDDARQEADHPHVRLRCAGRDRPNRGDRIHGEFGRMTPETVVRREQRRVGTAVVDRVLVVHHAKDNDGLRPAGLAPSGR